MKIANEEKKKRDTGLYTWGYNNIYIFLNPLNAVIYRIIRDGTN